MTREQALLEIEKEKCACGADDVQEKAEYDGQHLDGSSRTYRFFRCGQCGRFLGSYTERV